MNHTRAERYVVFPEFIVYDNLKSNELIKIHKGLNDTLEYLYQIDDISYRKSVFMNKETGFIENTFSKDDEFILIDNNYLYHTKEIININNRDKNIMKDVEHLEIKVGCNRICISIDNSIIVKKIYNNHTEYEIYSAEKSVYKSSYIHILQGVVIVYKKRVMYTEFKYKETNNTIYIYDHPTSKLNEVIEVKYEGSLENDSIPNLYYKEILPEFCLHTSNQFMRIVPKTLYQLNNCLDMIVRQTDKYSYETITIPNNKYTTKLL